MITPQQIDQVAFKKSSFGGYNMQQVDEFLEPLTEDYVTLYKENALLKSKLRVLAGKLEEYRKGEAAAPKAAAGDVDGQAAQILQQAQAQAAQALQNAQVQAAQVQKNAQIQRDQMLQQAQAQCDKLLKDAAANAQRMAAAVPAAPVSVPSNTEALIAAENARVEEARKAANAQIAEIQEQMRACIQALERIKAAAPAVTAAPKAASFTAPAAPAAPKAASFTAPAAPAAPKTASFTAPVAPAAPKAASFAATAAPKAARFAAPVEEPAVPEAPVSDALSFDSGSVADEIAHNIEALVGSAEEPAPKPEPKHPVNDTTTSRFANLNLQFGRNYDPTHK